MSQFTNKVKTAIPPYEDLMVKFDNMRMSMGASVEEIEREKELRKRFFVLRQFIQAQRDTLDDLEDYLRDTQDFVQGGVS